MPYTRMKRIFLQGLLWLYLLNFGYMALSLDNPGFFDFDNLPDTNFSCVGKVIGGYYADLETNCQMFHVCTIGQLDEPMDIRFLCLNGTVFDQETRVCEKIDEVDCSKSEQFYSLNLELYGNSQPAILEESPETDQPLIIKSTTPTTTTTTSTTPRPTLKTTRQPYYTTAAPPTITTSNSNHHFPIVNANSPDIRFNPEEINISLNPGAPPNIRTKPLIYQQQQHSYSSENNINKGVVTTVLPNREQIHLTTQKPKSIVSYGLTHPGSQKIHQEQHQSVTPTDINFGFTFRQQEEQQQTEYHTEPQHNYHYQSNLANFRPSFLQHKNQFRPTTYRSEFTPTTLKNSYSPVMLTGAGVITIFIIIIGVIGNMLTVAALLRHSKIRTVAAAFIANLCVSDLLFCFLVLPFSASQFFHGTWIHGDVLCTMIPALRYGSVGVSLLSVATISINRYILIAWPHLYNTIYTKVKVAIYISIIWMFSYGLQVPIIMGEWGVYGLDEKLGTCSIKRDKNGNSAKTAFFVIGFALPCFVIVVSYVSIFLVVRKSHRRLQQHSTGNKYKRSEMKITKMVLVIFVCFVVCYLPITIVKIFDTEVKHAPLHVVGYILIYLSSCVNPLIYRAGFPPNGALGQL